MRPETILSEGYDMHDIRYLKRQGLPYCRLRLPNESRSLLTIMPSFIIPFWVRRTQEAAKGLLMRYAVQSFNKKIKT